MKNTKSQLVAELAVLTVAIDLHQKKVNAAVDALDDAREFCKVPVVCGRYVYVSKDYPAVDAAERALEALRDDHGFYWAVSRYTDIAHALALRGGQIPLISYAEMNDAHPCVARFLRDGTASYVESEGDVFMSQQA